MIGRLDRRLGVRRLAISSPDLRAWRLGPKPLPTRSIQVDQGVHVLASSSWVVSPRACSWRRAARRKPPPPPPPLVIAAQPLQRQVEDWDDFVGQFESPASVDVRPRVTGYVTALGFKDGQEVTKGQVLFVIDPAPLRGGVRRRPRRRPPTPTPRSPTPRSSWRRSQALLAARATSQQDVDTRQAAAHTAAADVAAAAGRRAHRGAEPRLHPRHRADLRPCLRRQGDARQPGDPGCHGADQHRQPRSDPLPLHRAGVGVPEVQAPEHHRRRPARRPVQIRLQDEADYRWPGKLAFVDNAFDTSSGVISAYALVDNPGDFLTPGMFGHMRLLGSRRLHGPAGARPGGGHRPVPPGGLRGGAGRQGGRALRRARPAARAACG